MIVLYIHKILAQLGVRRGFLLALGSVVILVISIITITIALSFCHYWHCHYPYHHIMIFAAFSLFDENTGIVHVRNPSDGTCISHISPWSQPFPE